MRRAELQRQGRVFETVANRRESGPSGGTIRLTSRDMLDGLPGLRLLVITYSYPPLASVGSNRWAAMVRHMRALGHEVMVITSSIAGRIEDEIGVIRTPDLFASPALRGPLRAPPLPGPGEPPDGYSPPRTHERILVPDQSRRGGCRVLWWLPGTCCGAIPSIA